MSTYPTSGVVNGIDASEQTTTQRITGKLLATQGYVVGIEISGSGARLSAALADLDGTILYRLKRPLSAIPEPTTVLNLLDEMLHDIMHPDRLKGYRVLRTGVAVGGLVDAKHGIVQTLHHAHGWEKFPLQDYLADHLDIPCIIDNNANAAALAEVVRGVGQGERVVLYIGLGRGIGGGLVVNGHIYQGTTGTAGEIGHLLVKEHGPQCSCGGYGHLEAIASSQSIVRSLLELSAEYPTTVAALHQLTEGETEKLTVEHVFQLASKGDVLAQHIVQEVCTYLGTALANIIHLINPSMIILGGQVIQTPYSEEWLIAPVRRRVSELCLPAASQSLQIVPSRLGSEANLVGAVTLALQDI